MMDVVMRDSIQTENEDEGGFQSRCLGAGAGSLSQSPGT